MKALCMFILSGWLLVACKSQVSLSGATIPADAKTISVALFRNNSTLGAPSLSQRFTEKMRSTVSQQTNLALTAQNGDLQFEGYISDYQVAPVAVQSNDQAGQNRVTISVNVKYTNTLDPTKNFEEVFTQFADLPSNKNIATEEQTLVQEIFRKISEDVFNKAFNNW